MNILKYYLRSIFHYAFQMYHHHHHHQRIVRLLLPEVISELFSDDDDDDDTSEKHNGRYFEDNTLEYSSDDSEEDYQVNFDAPEIETEKINTRCTKKLDNTFSWIVIWILKFQQRFRLS